MDKTNSASTVSEKKDTSSDEPEASSVRELKETAELSDITRKAPAERAPKDSELKIEIVDQGVKHDSHIIETVYENAVIDKTVSSVTPSETTTTTIPSASAPSEICCGRGGESIIERGPVRSCRMNKMRDHASNIFPAGIMGCRENDNIQSPRRFIDAKEASHDNTGHIDNTPRKAYIKNDRVQSSKRNPVLGTGFESETKLTEGTNEESKTKLLENKVSGSTTRVPPGGYSQGLW